MLAQVLYGWLVAVGLLDTFLVSPAFRRATHIQTRGRLISTEFVLVGLVLCSYGRLVHPPPLTPIVVVGLVLLNVGLTGYALTLPGPGRRE